MPFHIKPEQRIKPETFAICLLLTCSLQIMENLMPRIPIFPWLRMGLAYWILLPFLLRFGVTQMLALFMFRNLVTLIYGGQVFSSFLISTSAGVISILLFGSIGRYLYNKNILGLIGLSVGLASTFNVSQLMIVDQMLIKHQDFYFQLAPILFWSLVSGSLIAFLVYKSRSILDQLFSSTFHLGENEYPHSTSGLSAKEKITGLLSLTVFCSIFVFQQVEIQLLYLVALALISKRKQAKILLHAWPFYFYIAWLHLFRTDGVYILGEWITREGLNAFLFYAFRTTNIILCGQWLAKYVPRLLENIRPNRYLSGTGYALPLLPSIFGISIALGKELFQKLKSREFDNLLEPVIQKLLEEFRNLEKA